MLAPGFKAYSGRLEKDSWHKIIREFDDLNLYQTCSHEVPRHGAEAVDHLILRDERRIVAAAQVRIMRIPRLPMGVAYVFWGPLWKHKGEPADPEIFRQAIRALRDEYAVRQGMLLRIFPMLFEDEDGEIRRIFNEEKFRKIKRKAGKRTLIVDIRPDISELRKNLHQKWRNCLNQAEKMRFEVIEGDDDGIFGTFVGLYRELLDRKKFREPNDINQFRLMQKDLPDDWKMRIFLCRSEDGIGSGAICSALGNRGIYLFGATNDLGLKNKGAYLLQWRTIQWLKETGCIWYDLNGIDPNQNPGTYRFKAGIAGAHGRDAFFLGQYDSYSTIPGFLISNWGDQLLSFARLFKSVSKRSLA